MKYFVYQGNEGDCGFASLKMLLARVYHNKRFLDLKKPPNKRRDYTFKDIVDIASVYGVSLKAYKYERKFDVVDKDSSIFMASLKRKSGGNHLFLVSKFTDEKLVIYDPSDGIYEIGFEEFLQAWTSYTLEVIEVKKMKFHLPKVRITNNILNICNYVISMISIISLILGMYFLKDINQILVPILFLVAYTLFDLLEKLFTIKSIQMFDKQYTPILASQKNNNQKECYKKYYEFKKAYFSNGKSFYLAMIFIASIVILFCFNSPMHAIPFLLILIIAILDVFVFEKNNKKKGKSIELMESEFFLTNDTQSKGKLLNQINKNTYSYVFNISAKKCVYNFICIMAAFFMMSIEKTISINFALFEFFAFSIYFENITNVLSYPAKKDEYNKLKAQFIDTFVF